MFALFFRLNMCGGGILRTITVLRKAPGVTLGLVLASLLAKMQHHVSFGLPAMKHFSNALEAAILAGGFIQLDKVPAAIMMEVDMDNGISINISNLT